MKLYAIHATVTEDGVTRQLPTFYLHPNVLGLLDEAAAEQVAYVIVDPLPVAGRTVVVSAFAVEMDGGSS